MIKNVVIGNTATNILSSSVGESFAGIGLYFCNTSNFEEGISLHVLESNAVVSDGNMIVRNLSIPSGSTYEFGAEKFLIQNGERIAAIGKTGSRVVATITYTEI